MSEVGQVLRHARDIVENGWCQYRVKDGDTYCMVGAVNKAYCGNPHLFHSAGTASHTALRLLLDCLPWVPQPDNPDYEWCNQVLPKFNDDSTTTKEDVLKVFDKALAELGEL